MFFYVNYTLCSLIRPQCFNYLWEKNLLWLQIPPATSLEGPLPPKPARLTVDIFAPGGPNSVVIPLLFWNFKIKLTLKILSQTKKWTFKKKKLWVTKLALETNASFFTSIYFDAEIRSAGTRNFWKNFSFWKLNQIFKFPSSRYLFESRALLFDSVVYFD